MSKKKQDVEWFVAPEKEQTCAACGCQGPLTLHHLVPQVKCRDKYRKTKDEESNHVMLCRPCHDQVHAIWSENELRDNYNTLEKLLAAPEFSKFVAWKKKHPEFTGHAKMSNKRKGK